MPVATGEFVTKGGGSTNHDETVPLGVKLEGRATNPDGADVQFDWSINGVPFRYSVRRDPELLNTRADSGKRLLIRACGPLLRAREYA